MSIQSATDFINLLNEDKETRGLVKQALEAESDQAARVVDLAAQRGHHFTFSEFTQVSEGLFEAEDRELDDFTLETVAGGVGGASPQLTRNLQLGVDAARAIADRLDHSPAVI